MKAILIDATAQTITYVQIQEQDGSNLDSIYKHLRCNLFEVVNIGKNDIYVDEEGLLNDPTKFFLYKGYPQPLAGNGLILGYNSSTGDSLETTLTIEEVEKNVKFLQLH